MSPLVAGRRGLTIEFVQAAGCFSVAADGAQVSTEAGGAWSGIAWSGIRRREQYVSAQRTALSVQLARAGIAGRGGGLPAVMEHALGERLNRCLGLGPSSRLRDLVCCLPNVSWWRSQSRTSMYTGRNRCESSSIAGRSSPRSRQNRPRRPPTTRGSAPVTPGPLQVDRTSRPTFELTARFPSTHGYGLGLVWWEPR